MEHQKASDFDILLVNHMHGNSANVIELNDDLKLTFKHYAPDKKSCQKTFLLNDRNTWYGMTSEAYHCMEEHFLDNVDA